jgi:adenosylcobyric acid synthase
MFMGTGSDVGKSLLVAGLCRALVNRGWRVAPFKPQNMSNNAGVTADGGEIGRAQMLQARAARQAAVTAMNPVLLKPEHDSGAQVIVRGRRLGSLAASRYMERRYRFLPEVRAAYAELCARFDIVLVEGAGSASEVNLRSGDIANFGFARAENVPVVLVGDIERGGVIASLVGTFAVIDPGDAALIRATLVNRFRGDPALFEAGREYIEKRTGVPCLGPVGVFADAHRLPAEDILGLTARPIGTGAFRIVVPRLPRIANFDDLDPLRLERSVSLEVVEPGSPLPAADLILLPGSKATRADLGALRRYGWDRDILRHRRFGGAILGICGGYQMLGTRISDPEGIEGEPGDSDGLGLLAVETVLTPDKELRVETGRASNGASISGYQMHMGTTTGPDRQRAFATIAGAAEGAISEDGKVMGTYIHGLFAADSFRTSFLRDRGASADASHDYEAGIEAALDGLAAHLERHLDVEGLLALAREHMAAPT